MHMACHWHTTDEYTDLTGTENVQCGFAFIFFLTTFNFFIMTISKVVSVFALVMGFASFSFAGSKEGNKDSGKTPAVSESTVAPVSTEATAGATTYYVVAQNATQYKLSTTPPPTGTCGSGSLPREISSQVTLPEVVSKSTITSNPNVTIPSNRNTLPSF